ncbi:unnamed protein product, partial [Iphiclides podalirius]
MSAEILYILKIAILLGVYGASLPRHETARLSISSIFETAVPAAIHPLIAAGSDRYGQDPKNITLIGHSLGAHIAGIASKSVRRLTGETIGRIIALDPAGPCFSNISHASRLDRDDAAFVDVIHTNGGILGLKEPLARKCNNWTMFRGGHCGNNELAFMGIKSKAGSSGAYFLTTSSSPPFGLGTAGAD